MVPHVEHPIALLHLVLPQQQGHAQGVSLSPRSHTRTGPGCLQLQGAAHRGHAWPRARAAPVPQGPSFPTSIKTPLGDLTSRCTCKRVLSNAHPDSPFFSPTDASLSNFDWFLAMKLLCCRCGERAALLAAARCLPVQPDIKSRSPLHFPFLLGISPRGWIYPEQYLRSPAMPRALISPHA